MELPKSKLDRKVEIEAIMNNLPFIISPRFTTAKYPASSRQGVQHQVKAPTTSKRPAARCKYSLESCSIRDFVADVHQLLVIHCEVQSVHRSMRMLCARETYFT